MCKKDSVEKRLTSSQLYQQQREAREQKVYCPAPEIICWNLQSPENIASIFRVADAMASEKIWFIQEEKLKFDDKKIKKISRNCHAHVNHEILLLEDFNQREFSKKLLAVELTNQSKSLLDIDFPEDCALVIGNERHGVCDELLQQCEYSVHIPMCGINGSMNVSHALAITLFEWRRQQAHINR